MSHHAQRDPDDGGQQNATLLDLQDCDVYYNRLYLSASLSNSVQRCSKQASDFQVGVAPRRAEHPSSALPTRITAHGARSLVPLASRLVK